MNECLRLTAAQPPGRTPATSTGESPRSVTPRPPSLLCRPITRTGPQRARALNTDSGPCSTRNDTQALTSTRHTERGNGAYFTSCSTVKGTVCDGRRETKVILEVQDVFSKIWFWFLTKYLPNKEKLWNLLLCWLVFPLTVYSDKHEFKVTYYIIAQSQTFCFVNWVILEVIELVWVSYDAWFCHF